MLAATLGGGIILAYLSGLLVYNRRQGQVFEFLCGGALGGEGYLADARAAKQSLFLMHVDDDAPSEELLAVYRKLLSRGVQLRRILFLRPDQEDGALSWVEAFGPHKNLEHRVVLPEESAMVRWSFAVIDEGIVILSVPGGDAIESDSYAKGLLFQDLLLIREPNVAAVFVEIHRALWARAEPLEDLSRLSHPKILANELRRRRGAS